MALRGIVGQMPVTLTNVSAETIVNLALTARSPACEIDTTPPSVAELLPGQNADMVLTMIRNPNVPEGEHPIFLSIAGNGAKLVLACKVTNAPEAEAFIKREYRKGWSL